MKKEERLQIRVSSEQAQFLKEYAARRCITISQMVRDFIDWLQRRDRERSNGDPRET